MEQSRKTEFICQWNRIQIRGKLSQRGILLYQHFSDLRYVFIEYETPEQAAAAIKSKDGHPLDKLHKLRVNRFTDVEKYATAPDEYVEPEIEPYVQKVQLTK